MKKKSKFYWSMHKTKSQSLATEKFSPELRN